MGILELFMIVPTDECHGILLMIRQHLFREWRHDGDMRSIKYVLQNDHQQAEISFGVSVIDNFRWDFKRNDNMNKSSIFQPNTVFNVLPNWSLKTSTSY